MNRRFLGKILRRLRAQDIGERLKRLVDPQRERLLIRLVQDYEAVPQGGRPREMLAAVLRRGCDVLERLGVKYWLGRGTVLGLHRDGDFLPGDNDIDVGIESDHDVYQILKAMPFEVLLVSSVQGRYMQIALIDPETQVIFDLWAYHPRGDQLHHRNLHGRFRLPRERLDRLHALTFEGREYPAPDPDWLCHYWYGPDWRTPKSYPGYWTEHYDRDCEGFELSEAKHVSYVPHYLDSKET